MANKTDIAKIVAVIGAAYPNFSPTKETVMVYYEMLKDLPADILEAATYQACAEAGRKFAPGVGELRGIVGEIIRKVQKIPTALEAWEETSTAPYRHVSENNPFYRGGERHTEDPDAHQWSHPLVEKVAKALGWPAFPKVDNLSVDRAHFLKHYESELAAYMSGSVQLPIVTAYIEAEQVKQLETQQTMKQLTKGMMK